MHEKNTFFAYAFFKLANVSTPVIFCNGLQIEVPAREEEIRARHFGVFLKKLGLFL